MSESFPITREFLLQVGGWAALKEAETLFKSGRIGDVTYEPPFLSGPVATANGVVQARIKLSNQLSTIENLCSCRHARVQGIICPHVLGLGLKLIAPPPATAKAASSPNPSPKLVKTIPPRPSRFYSENDVGTVPLNLYFLLPIDLPHSWNSGPTRIIVEASLEGQPPRPLDTSLKQFSGMIPVAEDCLAAIRFLERRSAEPLPSMWLLEKADRDRFFSTLVGCSNVSLGKKTLLTVCLVESSPKIDLETDLNGALRIHLRNDSNTLGVSLPSLTGRWHLHGTTHRFRSQPSPVVAQLENGPVVLPRAQVARFIHQELPVLTRQTEVNSCPRTQQIELVERVPKIRATLDGGISSLSCRLEADYNGTVIPLTESSKAGSTAWTPDEKNPLRYYSRSPQLEEAARMALSKAGFSPGLKQPEYYTLSGEEACLRFLANQYPQWRGTWDIHLQPRLQSFLSQCDWIRPEATIRTNNNEWLNVDITFRSDDGKVVLTPGEIQQLLQTGQHSRRMKSGRTAFIPSETIEEWQETLQDCDELSGMSGVQVSSKFAPYLQSSLKLSGQSWTPPRSLVAPDPLQLPDHLEKTLRPYQRTGVEWITYLAHNGFAGILADEMGLGKTIQTIAFLEHRRLLSRTTDPVLIVCPTSLLTNWRNEILKFNSSLKTSIWHGSGRHKGASGLMECDILITSYALIRRDIELFQPQTFDVVVLDEAQHIKNRFSQSAQVVKLLKAPFRMILTGTPMENSLLDLWSMFDFLMPGYLGSAKSFRDRYEQPITKSGDVMAQSRLTRRLQPFVLRRTKAEVAPELPAMLDTVLYTDLTGEQAGVYQQILEAGRREIFELSGQGDAGKRTMAMLTTLTRLRQASCHLSLLPNPDARKWTEPSGKLETFMETLQEAMDGGHRVLLFSQFVKLLKLVEVKLAEESIPYCYLDGGTEDRDSEVARFQKNADIPVFLISLKAGGTGLNLTGADTVVHFDPWWNPAVEEQATARAHRIGQNRIVTSYKLIARGTVEEKILELQRKKKALLAQTVFNEQGLMQQLNADEWNELLEFKLEEGGVGN